MRALAGLLCGLLGLVPGAAAYEPDVFGTAGQVAGQAVYDLGGSGLPCRGGPPPTELSLEEAIERILCHDPQTRLAWANAKAQAAQVGIGKSAYLPRLDGRLDASRGYSDMDYRDAPYLSGDGHRHRRGASLQLSWVLFDFGRRSAALRNAQQLLLAANASQDATLQNTFALAAQAYYDALAAQRSLAASRQVAELAAQNLEAADAKYRAGAAALSDRLQAQTALSQASLAQVRDEGALSNALGVIALRMGLAPDTPLRLSGELEAQPDTGFVKAIDEMLAEARREHPALLAAQARLKAAAASVEESRAAGRPSLALSANLARSHSDQAMAFNGDTRERDRSIGLQLNIPLFEGFERTYQVRNALRGRQHDRAAQRPDRLRQRRGPAHPRPRQLADLASATGGEPRSPGFLEPALKSPGSAAALYLSRLSGWPPSRRMHPAPATRDRMIDDIRYLIVFAKIAETGSVSGGAEALGLSAATASLHLSRLERNLGRALLYRNSRKLSLTQDGTQLLDTARSMLELYEKGFIEFRQRAVSTRNSLRISMPAVFVNGDFTRHLAAFIEEHPDLDLGIACDDSRHDIIGDGIDIAFRIGDLPDSSLKARHLFLLPRQVVAAPAFLARHAPLEHPRDLQRLEWIGLGMRPDSRLFRHARDDEEVRVDYTARVRVDSVEASCRLARLGVGLAAPPTYLSDEPIRRGELRAVLPEWRLEPLKVYAVWPPNVPASSIAYTLINRLYEAFNPG